MIGNIVPAFKKKVEKVEEEEFKEIQPQRRPTLEQWKKTIVEKMQRKQTIKKAEKEDKFASIL